MIYMKVINVYEGNDLRILGLCSIDSESTTAEQQEKRALMKNSGSPSSDRYVNDSNLGEREDAINQGRSIKNA